MLMSMFKRKADGARQAAARIENRDLMQAIVGGAILIAAADGDIEDSELAKIEKLVAANPSLAHFGNEIGVTMNRFREMCEAGFRMGRVKILREIEDVKTNPQHAEEAFIMMVEIAEADGEIEAAERAVLTEVATKLGLSLKAYGL